MHVIVSKQSNKQTRELMFYNLCIIKTFLSEADLRGPFNRSVQNELN